MNCTCGYDFAEAALASLRHGKRKHKSYAAIADEDYRRFIRLECKALAARDKSSKLKYIAKSAELAGTVMICPKCSRLTILMPKTAELVRYKKDNE